MSIVLKNTTIKEEHTFTRIVEEYDDEDEKYDTIPEDEKSKMDLVNKNRLHYIDRDTYKLYILKNLEEFSNDIELFTNNNPINYQHVENLKKSFLNNKNTSLDSIFVVVKFIDNRIILIDGHHRIKAFNELYNSKNLKKDFEYEIHLYELDIEYDSFNKKVLNLFYQVNNTKPYTAVYNIISVSTSIYKTLKKIYPKLFTQGKIRANFPHIRENQFNEKLIEKLYQLDRIDEHSILENIYKKNEEYERNCIEILKKIKPNNYMADLDKINAFGIYLGIQRNNVDWLDDIF